jgi:dipeptidase D
LALFTDRTVIHGPLEAVFTVEEETTTIGATKLENNVLNSKYLINVDCETDNEIIVGNGGSCDFIGCLGIQRAKRSLDTVDISITLSGAVSGHSGADIHQPHINAILKLINILKSTYKKYPFLITEIKTTSTLNVIPA